MRAAAVSARAVSARAPVAGRPRAAAAPPRTQVGEIQRSRLLAGAVAAVGELGYEGATVGRITARARVSRRTFYELFANRDECVAAVLQDAAERARCELAAGVGVHLPWRKRMRAGMEVILGFLDRDPVLARVCVVDALRAGTCVQECREQILAGLVAVVDEGRGQGARDGGCSAVTAEGVVGAALAIVHARLAHPGSSRREAPGLLVGLLGELSAMVVLPYLGPAAARRERSMPTPIVTAPRAPAAATLGAEDPLGSLPLRLTYRTVRVLEAVGELAVPGCVSSNRAIAEWAGVADAGQISKLLRRLERLGLLANKGGGHLRGEPNEWTLTASGECIVRGLSSHRQKAA